MFGLQLDPGTSRTSWREAIAFPGLISLPVMVTAFFPGLVEREVPDALGVQVSNGYRTSSTLFIYVWIPLTMAIAWLTKNFEHTRAGRWVSPVPIYVIGFGPRAVRGDRRRVLQGAAPGGRAVGEDREDREGRGMRRATRAKAGQGRPVRSPGPLEARRSPELEQYDEIEHDHLSERRLVVQSLLAMLFVVVLVVVGRLLSP